MGGGSQQSHTLHVNYTCGKCLSYNASLYCLWLHSPPSASPAAQQNQNLIMGCFSKKGQHAKPYALLAILYKDTTPCAGQMEGCWGSVSDPFTYFNIIEIFFNIITECVPSAWCESRFHLLVVQLLSVPFQSQFLAFKWFNGPSLVAAFAHLHWNPTPSPPCQLLASPGPSCGRAIRWQG